MAAPAVHVFIPFPRTGRSTSTAFTSRNCSWYWSICDHNWGLPCHPRLGFSGSFPSCYDSYVCTVDEVLLLSLAHSAPSLVAVPVVTSTIPPLHHAFVTAEAARQLKVDFEDLVSGATWEVKPRSTIDKLHQVPPQSAFFVSCKNSEFLANICHWLGI